MRAIAVVDQLEFRSVFGPTPGEGVRVVEAESRKNGLFRFSAV